MGAVSGAPGSSCGLVSVRFGIHTQAHDVLLAHGPQTSGDPVPASAAFLVVRRP
ncbi:MAG: hypothetical protein QOJ47_1227, partial [Gaiellales bacterium]|nr:hypothetical protein [Gaiellales bacterium]